MLLDCDFHLHSKYSAATSANMTLENIAVQGPLKGLHLIGTGDALHPAWLADIKRLKEHADGIYAKNRCKFIITTEVEDAQRVHHLIFIPSVSSAEGLSEEMKKHSKDIAADGRPKLHLNAQELLDYVTEAGGHAGPSHAFVPWTSIYKEYASIGECYGKNAGKIKFLELGLSADTEMASKIKELEGTAFLTNSDAHSPWPNRLGREFNRIEVKDLTFKDVMKAITAGGIKLNVGLDPRLGKYHRTACIKCYTLYGHRDAKHFKYKCQACGGRMKKGVHDRVEELWASDFTPKERPPYIRIAPLADLISQAIGIKNVYSDKVQNAWKSMVEHFGTEIAVLIDVPIEDIRGHGGEKLAALINAYRRGRFKIQEGGGGKYGEVVFSGKKVQNFYTGNQSNLEAFVRR